MTNNSSADALCEARSVGAGDAINVGVSGTTAASCTEPLDVARFGVCGEALSVVVLSSVAASEDDLLGGVATVDVDVSFDAAVDGGEVVCTGTASSLRKSSKSASAGRVVSFFDTDFDVLDRFAPFDDREER